MDEKDCEDLRVRAEMLHREAELGLEQAIDNGPRWPKYREQIEIANKVDAMAQELDAKIEHECD